MYQNGRIQNTHMSAFKFFLVSYNRISFLSKFKIRVFFYLQVYYTLDAVETYRSSVYVRIMSQNSCMSNVNFLLCPSYQSQ